MLVSVGLIVCMLVSVCLIVCMLVSVGLIVCMGRKPMNIQQRFSQSLHAITLKKPVSIFLDFSAWVGYCRQRERRRGRERDEGGRGNR